MNNWRKILSWDTSVDELKIGDKVEVIATKELLSEIGIIYDIVGLVIGARGKVLKIIKTTGWPLRQTPTERGSYVVQFFNGERWQFPLVEWREYLREI